MTHKADKIRNTRKQLGMSQSAFARAVGIDRRSLQRYEGAEREPPTPLLMVVDFISRYGMEHMADYGVSPRSIKEGAEDE